MIDDNDMNRILARVKEICITRQECDTITDDINKKLSNANFVSRAPKEVVDKERQHIAESEEKLARVREQLANFAAN